MVSISLTKTLTQKLQGSYCYIQLLSHQQFSTIIFFLSSVTIELIEEDFNSEYLFINSTYDGFQINKADQATTIVRVIIFSVTSICHNFFFMNSISVVTEACLSMQLCCNLYHICTMTVILVIPHLAQGIEDMLKITGKTKFTHYFFVS